MRLISYITGSGVGMDIAEARFEDATGATWYFAKLDVWDENADCCQIEFTKVDLAPSSDSGECADPCVCADGPYLTGEYEPVFDAGRSRSLLNEAWQNLLVSAIQASDGLTACAEVALS